MKNGIASLSDRVCYYFVNMPEIFARSTVLGSIKLIMYHCQVGILGNAADFYEEGSIISTVDSSLDRRQMMIAFDMRCGWKKATELCSIFFLNS